MAKRKPKRCAAITTAGNRCKHKAKPGADHCATHAGSSATKPKPKRKAKAKGTKRKATRRRTPRTLTAKKRSAYLESRRCGVNKAQAAAAAGIPRRTLYDAFDADEEFRAADQEAVEAGVHAMVDNLYTKAMSESRGAVVAAIFWLKNRSSDRWSDVKEVQVVERLLREEREKLAAALEAAGVTDAQLARIDAVLNGDDAASTGGAVH